MSNPDGVLASIDACLDDYELSDDAMRWAPDAPDPTPRNDLADPVAEWVEEHAGLQLPEWQRRYLDTLTPAVEAGTLVWDSELTPPREAVFDAIGGELATPSQDGLLRLSMPDASESLHRVVSVTPGEMPGEFVLHLERAEDAPGPVQTACRGASAAGAVFDEYVMAARPRVAALNEFASELQSAARAAAGAFGNAFGPAFAAVQSNFHREAYKGVQGHKRRCPTCNPYAFPKPLAIDGREYNRRRRRRRR